MDFTLEKYQELLQIIKDNDIPTFGMHTWLKREPKRGILVRHDVDRKPKNALKMAKLEKKFGINSTYYFRTTKGVFNNEIIKEVADLGFEIGYHYEDLSEAGGDYEKAIKLFEKNLEKMREIAEIKTIAMHGRPLSKYDNRDLWKKHDFKKYNLEAEAFLSIDYSDIYYLTDTGRSWSPQAINLRDHVQDKKEIESGLRTTDDLGAFILKHRDKRTALVAHPERWDDNFFDWSISLLRDTAVNLVKLVLKQLPKWKLKN